VADPTCIKSLTGLPEYFLDGETHVAPDAVVAVDAGGVFPGLNCVIHEAE